MIPSELGSWQNLTMIDFSGNKLFGPIPRELGALSKLGTLRISSNKLTGPIPHELGNCTNLLCLDLGNNLLTGSIPAEITTLGRLQNLLLGGNNLNGTIPDSFTATQGLIELHLGDNCLEGAIPRSIGNLQYMSKALNLSGNRLSSQIPSSLGNLQDLEVLDLSKNSLSGPIPSQLINMISLLSVNISFNQLSGQLPASWVKLAAQSPQGFLGNPQLCIEPAVACFKTLSKRNRYRYRRIIVALVVSILSIMVAGLCVIHYLVKKSWLSSRSRGSSRNLDTTEELPEDLTYEDILRATDNWSEKYVIGRGRHGTVYRTECKLGKQWAVKTVDLSQCKFPIEMKILNTIKHRNIIKMDGYCIRGSIGLILYEYMPNGTLFDLLHERKPQVDLGSMARHQIALGIAQGLSYLHHDCVPMIVHRDVKSSNILMDIDLVPKLTDFGMGKIVDDKDADATVSVVVGTLGYIAPEHGYSTRLSEKSDVYSYGVVLLEILFRKMPVDPSFGDGVDIVAWMRSNLKQEDPYSIIRHMDEEIMCWPEDEQTMALELLDLAVSCTQVASQSRPSMREVVNILMKMSRGLCFRDDNSFRESRAGGGLCLFGGVLLMIKPAVGECIRRREPVFLLEAQQATQEFAGRLRQLLRQTFERLHPLGVDLVSQMEHLHEHVVLRVHMLEQGHAGEELDHDAAERPHIHGGAVALAAHELLRRPVPERSDALLLVRRPHRRGHAEIANLERAAAADENVLRLDVAVDRPGAVDPLEAAQKLEHERSRLELGEGARQAAAEAGPDELHDEEEAPGGLVRDHVPDLHDRRVAAAGSEAAGLADDRAEVGRASVDAADPLDRDLFAGAAVARLDDDAVGALPELIQLLVVVDRAELVPPRPLLAGHREGTLGRWPLTRRRRRRHELSLEIFETRERERRREVKSWGARQEFDADWTADSSPWRIR
ncbi:hypothetical protein EJB05_22978 [Eragrostis curvula]|uniref:Protein kinase domain-containing protein n=1 Tax=Eragrostis curvula TaxID=38414 RepID=A0A5J9V5U8_9POAL|nr:hypothetical protein EJB05_22978 [Eragrostis curvula]